MTKTSTAPRRGIQLALAGILSLAMAAPVLAGGDRAVRDAITALIQEGNLDAARELAHRTSVQYPQFRLANFVEAEALAAMAGQEVAVPGSAQVRIKAEAHDLLEEARLRANVPDQLAQLRPVQVMRMPRGTDYLILVDAGASRAYLLHNQDGEPVWVSDYYVTIGKRGYGKERQGDQKTPLGLYAVQSEINKARLGAFYGDGALPLDYPNALDRYLSHTGYGIWLHGVPKTMYSRPPRASDGCVVLSNEDLNTVRRVLKGRRAMVLLTSEVQWVDQQTWRRRVQQSLEEAQHLAGVSRKVGTGASNPVQALYSPEPESSFIIDRMLEGGSKADIQREYWVKRNDKWTLSFKYRPGSVGL